MRAGAWSNTATSPPRFELAAGAPASRMHYPNDDPERDRHAHRAAHLLCGNAFRAMTDISGDRLRRIAEVVHGSRGQGVAGHRHGRAGAGAHVSWPVARGVAAGLRNHGLLESIGDPRLDGRAVLHRDRRKNSDRRNGRGAALVADRHRPGRRPPRQRQLHHRVAVGVGAGHARHRPMWLGPCGVAGRHRPGAGMARSADPMSRAR